MLLPQIIFGLYRIILTLTLIYCFCTAVHELSRILLGKVYLILEGKKEVQCGNNLGDLEACRKSSFVQRPHLQVDTFTLDLKESGNLAFTQDPF